MKKYNGTYKVVHNEWNQSLPEIYTSFQAAFDAQQKWDTTASIMQIDGEAVGPKRLPRPGTLSDPGCSTSKTACQTGSD